MSPRIWKIGFSVPSLGPAIVVRRAGISCAHSCESTQPPPLGSCVTRSDVSPFCRPLAVLLPVLGRRTAKFQERGTAGLPAGAAARECVTPLLRPAVSACSSDCRNGAAQNTISSARFNCVWKYPKIGCDYCLFKLRMPCNKNSKALINPSYPKYYTSSPERTQLHLFPIYLKQGFPTWGEFPLGKNKRLQEEIVDFPDPTIRFTS